MVVVGSIARIDDIGNTYLGHLNLLSHTDG